MATKSTTSKPDREQFSPEERAAMKERAKELKAAQNREAGQSALLDKIAEMDGTDRSLAQAIHRIVTEAAPDLAPSTWYGMPSYNDKDGKAVVFFQPAAKFKARYATLGFNEQANLDDGAMWPTSYAVTDLTKTTEKAIAELVRKAVG